MSTPLTDAINALTTYANGITGKSDSNLPDAVRSLADGYGQSGGEEETGTFTASADGNPTITFSNSHTKSPSIILFMKTNTSTTMPINCGTFFAYIKVDDFFSVGLQTVSDIFRTGLFMQAHTQSSGSTQIGAGTTEVASQIVILSTGFKPYFGSSSYVCRSGNTYKWIAVWK